MTKKCILFQCQFGQTYKIFFEPHNIVEKAALSTCSTPKTRQQNKIISTPLIHVFQLTNS